MGPYGWLWPIPGWLTWILSILYTHKSNNHGTLRTIQCWTVHMTGSFFPHLYNLPHKVHANHWAKVNSQTHNDTHILYVICITYLQTKVSLFRPSSLLLPLSHFFLQCPLQAQTVAGSQCAAIARAASVIAVSPGPMRPADNLVRLDEGMLRWFGLQTCFIVHIGIGIKLVISTTFYNMCNYTFISNTVI